METRIDLLPVDAEKVIEYLRRIDVEKSDTSAGAAIAENICKSGYTFSVQENGKTFAAYNLQIDNHGVAWIMAAGGGRAGVDLTSTVTPSIEAQARELGARQIAFNTKRRGLVRKMERLGFSITSVTLRKNLQ